MERIKKEVAKRYGVKTWSEVHGKGKKKYIVNKAKIYRKKKK